MLVICWVKTHTLMPLWRALNPRETSWLVRPFTSFEAAQSSRMMSVFVASKKKLASLRKPVYNENAMVIIYEAVKGLVVDKVGQINTM